MDHPSIIAGSVTLHSESSGTCRERWRQSGWCSVQNDSLRRGFESSAAPSVSAVTDSITRMNLWAQVKTTQSYFRAREARTRTRRRTRAMRRTRVERKTRRTHCLPPHTRCNHCVAGLFMKGQHGQFPKSMSTIPGIQLNYTSMGTTSHSSTDTVVHVSRCQQYI